MPPIAQTNRQTDILQTDGHSNSMTELAQWDQFSENHLSMQLLSRLQGVWWFPRNTGEGPKRQTGPLTDIPTYRINQSIDKKKLNVRRKKNIFSLWSWWGILQIIMFVSFFPWIPSTENSTSLFLMDTVLVVKWTQALCVLACIYIYLQKDRYYVQHFIDRWIQPIFQEENSIW